jgi:ankyrin repeat protein
LLKNFPEQELDPNIKSAAGMTPAMYAQGNNFTGTLKALLQDQRTDVNARDRAGNTILDRSVDGGQLDNMTAILAHPGVSAQDKTKAVNHQYEVGGTRMTPLMLAEDLGNQEAFDAFLKVPGIDFKAKDDQGSSILARLALPGGSLKNIKAILQHSGVDADVVNGKSDKGNNPLHIAAMHNRADVIEALVLDGRLKPEETNKDGHTAVFLAGQLGHVDALRKMAEMKAEGKAAFDLNPSMEVKNSQDAYVNGVKIPKSDRVTLANKVATRGTAEVAKLLLEHGVDFNATNRVGIPLVYAAALEGNLPVFDVLRKHPSLKFDEPARNVNGVVGDSPSRTFLTYLSQMMVVYEERDDYKKAGLPNQFNTPSPGLDMEKIKAAFSHMERAYPVAKEIKAGIAKAIKDDLATQIKNREARDAYLQ